MAPGITLYPCPALTKMSSADPTAWIADRSAEGTRIGIAHGTVMNALVAEDCFPIRPDAASAAGLDYLALGHWHSFAPYEGDADRARMAYSGTHETTKFGERDSGNVLIVEIPGRGERPHLTRVPTGVLQWHQFVYDIGSTIDIEQVLHELDAVANPQQSLLDIRLIGTIHPSKLKHVDLLRDKLAARFPLLGRVDDSKLLPFPKDGAWDEALPAGLLRDVARAIRTEGSESAAKALMLLYRYSRESGEVAA
jgi:DNA repair exonuclease SbcCD nuclease subunit